MAYDNILFEVTYPLALLTLNRPPMNPLNLAILEEMQQVVEQVAGDPRVRVLIITGAGDKAFVAGADIKAMTDMTSEQIARFAHAGQNLMRSLENLPIPVIAAVNGFALGGGTELAISCDIIVASEKAKFGQPEVKLGIIPGFGGTQRLPRLIGRNMAKELIYRGNIIDAQEALRIGLANHVVPADKLMETVTDMANEIVGVGPKAVSFAKQAINQGYHKELDEGNRIEFEAFLASFQTEDRQIGMAAFLEKRKAEFVNR
ncbi:MAG: enoyl-CoA hydratase/isomerase family protein [Bradymonadales bacterium]|nr:enoyl-CoA hydratase/isomerase family protein [Bradymonadales bacterium]